MTERSFRDLSPRERVAVVDGYVAEQPWAVNGTRLSERTLEWIERAKLALLDDSLDSERREELHDAWHRHLEGLSEADADEARYRLRTFVEFADGLLRSEEPDE